MKTRAASAPGAAPLLAFLQWLGDLAQLGFQAGIEVASGRTSWRETVLQMHRIGVASLPIVLVTICFSGMVMALHTANELKRMGADSLVGGLVAVSMAREAAPVLTAIVVAARAGSAIAAQIGSMVVTEQIDALRSLGVSPVRYLVAPRLLAAVVMLPVLTLFADCAGVAGGYLVAVGSAHVRSTTYLTSARDLTEPSDVLLGLAKTLIFGAIVAVVGCAQGLRTRGGADGVGRATTGSVVASIVLVYIADYFLAEWMFGNEAIKYG